MMINSVLNSTTAMAKNTASKSNSAAKANSSSSTEADSSVTKDTESSSSGSSILGTISDVALGIVTFPFKLVYWIFKGIGFVGESIGKAAARRNRRYSFGSNQRASSQTQQYSNPRAAGQGLNITDSASNNSSSSSGASLRYTSPSTDSRISSQENGINGFLGGSGVSRRNGSRLNTAKQNLNNAENNFFKNLGGSGQSSANSSSLKQSTRDREQNISKFFTGSG